MRPEREKECLKNWLKEPAIKLSSTILFVLLATLLRAQEPAVDPLYEGTNLQRTPDESELKEGHLTGDWGGARTDLKKNGVEFIFQYSGEVLSNVSGGRENGTAYDGLLQSGVDIDMEQLAGWKGGHFYIDSLWFHGPNLSNNATGNILTDSSLSDFDTIRLYELWVQQNFFEDLLSLKVGMLDAGREFAYSDYGSLFINATFGLPAVIWDNEPSLTYYITSLGARIRLQPTEEIYLQAGCYDGNPDPTADSHTDPSNLNSTGTRISLTEGAVVLMEAGYKLNQGKDSKGLPGIYKVGGWIHTHVFANQYDSTLSSENSSLTPAVPRTHRGNSGVYAAASQLVFREKDGGDEGLGLFGYIGGNPSDRNQIDFYAHGGVTYTGPIPTRDEDVIGIAYAYAAISDDIRQAYRDMNSIGEGPFAVPDYESVLEITYRAAITSWCTLQPDFQWIFHPGGSSQLPDAVVVGVRTVITF